MNMTGHFSEHISCREHGFCFIQVETSELCQILTLFCVKEHQGGVSTCLPLIQDSDREASIIKSFLMFLSCKWLPRRWLCFHHLYNIKVWWIKIAEEVILVWVWQLKKQLYQILIDKAVETMRKEEKVRISQEVRNVNLLCVFLNCRVRISKQNW